MGVLLDSIKMEACLPLDKLTRTKEALHELSHKKSATLKELQSLIDTLQFACKVVVPGRAFLQRIISLTKGISNSRWHIKLNTEFRKDISMTLAFLEHWNGVSFFLGATVLSSPDLQLLALVSLSVMVGTLMVNGFKATGSHNTPLTLLLGSALTGRNFLPFLLLAFSGVPTGRVNIFFSHGCHHN